MYVCVWHLCLWVPFPGNRLPTGRSSPTPTPRRARERSSPLIGSQPMGVGESCYSVPSLVRFPLVRACRTTLREAFGLLKRCSCSRRELQELKSQTLQGDWAGGRSGRGASWPSPLEWSGGRTQMRRVARGSRGPRKGSGERRPPVGAHGPRLRLGPRYVGPLGPGRAPTHIEPLGEIPQVL